MPELTYRVQSSLGGALNLVLLILAFSTTCLAQQDSVAPAPPDSLHTRATLNEVVITASRVPPSLMEATASLDILTLRDARFLGSLTPFEALNQAKGIQVITPSMGFRVITSRGFAHTTNVRFAQLVEGADNQAPHIGAPVADAFGPVDLDIDRIEVIPGTASAVYGINATSGLIHIRTLNPFDHPGTTIQVTGGMNRPGGKGPSGFSQAMIRWARQLHSNWAVKVCGSAWRGTDWTADDRTDLAKDLNLSAGLPPYLNPAYDEVNSYGNESPNRRTLTLGGTRYVVARTGYRESDFADHGLSNVRADAGLWYRPRKDREANLTFRVAEINTLYQRANRFRLEDYLLAQAALHLKSRLFECRSYVTTENTGNSYNLRSLAENMDRAHRSDADWFSAYTQSWNAAFANGADPAEAHLTARPAADSGRLEPGTTEWDRKINELVQINNWDRGAALRVRATLAHAEGILHWSKCITRLEEQWGTRLISGFDHRTYLIIPDGNYFIQPDGSGRNLTYSKSGGFIEASGKWLKQRIHWSTALRADKADFFDWKFNPRISLLAVPTSRLSVRLAWQTGYRFPSIFEGFSNVNSGGVRRVGGLRIMSDGIFERSWTRTSIEAFQAKVNSDINEQGITEQQAIESNRHILQRNPYTYLQPEQVKSLEGGIRWIALREALYVDLDGYMNTYSSFIAQMEASVPLTDDPDSIPAYLYSRETQNRYRLWTNSTSRVRTYGASVGIRYVLPRFMTLASNATWTRLKQTEHGDGLEDGFNTPEWMFNVSLLADRMGKGWTTGITWRGQSSFAYESFLADGTVPAWSAWDVQVSKTWKKNGRTIRGGGTNVTGQPVHTMLGGPRVGSFFYLSLLWSFQEKPSP